MDEYHPHPFGKMTLYMGIFGFALFLFFIIAPEQIPGKIWEFVLLTLSFAALLLGIHSLTSYKKDRVLAIIGTVLGAIPFIAAFVIMSSNIGPAAIIRAEPVIKEETFILNPIPPEVIGQHMRIGDQEYPVESYWYNDRTQIILLTKEAVPCNESIEVFGYAEIVGNCQADDTKSGSYCGMTIKAKEWSCIE